MKNIYDTPAANLSDNEGSGGSVVLALLIGIFFRVVFPIIFNAVYAVIFISYRESRGFDANESVQILLTDYRALSVSLIAYIVFAWCAGYYCSKVVKNRKYLWVTILLVIFSLLDLLISYFTPDEFVSPKWFFMVSTVLTILMTYLGAYSWRGKS